MLQVVDEFWPESGHAGGTGPGDEEDSGAGKIIDFQGDGDDHDGHHNDVRVQGDDRECLPDAVA